MATDGDSIDRAIDIRTRYQRQRWENRTADERLAEMAKLQQVSFRVLCESPSGYQHFLRRNMASRRAEVIDGVWKPVSPARLALHP
jgi:hypothetical protein